MEEQVNQIETLENSGKLENKYSMYDYLKKNSGVAIAAGSFIVAVITFFAKASNFVLNRKQLIFWEFDSSYATLGNESIIFLFAFSILCSCFISISTMLFSSTYEAFAPRLKCHLLTKYFLKKERQNIKKMKSKKGNNKENENDIDLLESLNKLKDEVNKTKKHDIKKLISNLSVVFIFIIMNSCLLLVFSEPIAEVDILWNGIVLIIVQILMLLIIKVTINAELINKRELKKNCQDPDFILITLSEQKKKEYPLDVLRKNGLRAIMSNNNIILIGTMLLFYCFVFLGYISFSNNYLVNSKKCQITIIDNTPYAIVYRDGDKYFLEETNVKTERNNNEVKEILVVYTNKQRIVKCDDISFSVEKYDDIVKEHK